MRLHHIALRIIVAGFVLAPALSIAGAQVIDRSKPPVAAPAPPLRIPVIATRTLSNGIQVVVLENHEIPIVRVRAVIDASALLEAAGKEGLASVTFAMLGEGTATRSADQLSDAFAALGNGVSPTGFLTITKNLAPSLALMADQLENPAFPQEALDRIRANRLADLKRLQDQPSYLAQRVFANAVYGTGHPYERAATEQSLTSLARADLVEFHDTWFRPQNVKFVVAGDITPDAARAELEKAFASWPSGGKKSTYTIAAPKTPGPTTIYLFDRPSSAQSYIMAGSVGPRRDVPEYFALDIANNILGGTFNSRLNLNLREKHGYSYGANSRFTYRRVPQVGQFTAASQVATAKTDSSVIELMRELREIHGARPVSDSEVTHSTDNILKGMPLDFETVDDIAGAAANLLGNELPLDYYQTVSDGYRRAGSPAVRAAAAKFIDPEHLVVVVVGDRKAIEAALRAAHVAPVVVVDDKAKPVESVGGR
jgi:zinc protease